MRVLTVPEGPLNIKKTCQHYCACIQGESVAKRSTKLNQQNESFCVSREKLLTLEEHWVFISGFST